jgi:hypothetical protein
MIWDLSVVNCDRLDEVPGVLCIVYSVEEVLAV